MNVVRLHNEGDVKHYFEDLYKKLYVPLYFYATKFIHDRDIARDLVQDAFLNLLKNENEIIQIQNVKSYLFKSVHNNCINHLNHIEIENEYHKKEVERIKKELAYYDLNKTLVEQDLHRKITEAVKELPDHYRIPFELSRYEDLKNSEIAKRLKIPVRTVDTQIYRALALLRDKLKGLIS